MAATCLNIQSVGVVEKLIALLASANLNEVTLRESSVEPVRFSFRGEVDYFHHRAKHYTLARLAEAEGVGEELPQMDFYAFPFEDRLMVAPVSLTLGGLLNKATFKEGGRWVMRTDKMALQASYANQWLDRLRHRHSL